MYVTSGMERFAHKDTELALVIGHEIAHNILEHITKKNSNTALGTIADILITSAIAVTTGAVVNTGNIFQGIGAKAHSKEFEAEADYAGLYIVARGGYNINNVADFWRKMGTETPSSIEKNYSSSHPSSAERFIAIDKAINEINIKKQKGSQIIPD